MPEFLGEAVCGVIQTPYSSFGPKDWVLYFIDEYGQIDGSHHKQWVLDQVARITCGTEVIVSRAAWDDGQEEYRVNLGEPSSKYLEWRTAFPYYDEGIAP